DSIRPPSRSSALVSQSARDPRDLHSFPTRRSSDLTSEGKGLRPRARLPSRAERRSAVAAASTPHIRHGGPETDPATRPHHEQRRSEEHTSELQSRENLVCRLLLEKKKGEVLREKQG